MNAPKINHTVLLEKPESAQLKEALGRIKARLRELLRANIGRIRTAS